jgi:hypothetical protein
MILKFAFRFENHADVWSDGPGLLVLTPPDVYFVD